MKFYKFYKFDYESKNNIFRESPFSGKLGKQKTETDKLPKKRTLFWYMDRFGLK